MKVPPVFACAETPTRRLAHALNEGTLLPEYSGKVVEEDIGDAAKLSKVVFCFVVVLCRSDTQTDRLLY